MAENDGSFKLEARCFGFLRSGRRWLCFDEVLVFLLALLHLVTVLVECLVWREGLFHPLGHIFDPLKAFCYSPFFLYFCSLTVPLYFPFPVSPEFSSSASVPHRMRYVGPQRIRKSHEWDCLLCCVCQLSYALLCCCRKCSKRWEPQICGRIWTRMRRLRAVVSANELKQWWLS